MAPKRLRGHDLELELEKTATYRGVVTARTQQRYLSVEDKLRYDISLNIYDAARSYKETHGDTRGLRAIIKDTTFRKNWNTFRGGYRWKYDREKSEWVTVYKKKGGIQSTFKEKMKAATVLGWHRDEPEAIEKLRNMSP